MSATESETRARTMGWLPKEKFLEHGRPEAAWVDADEYLKRGDSIMPILQANNKKLADQVAAQEAQIQTTNQLLKEARESIEELKNFRSELSKDKVKDQKAAVLSALAQAKKDGDVETEVRLTDQLTEINASLKEPAAKPPTKEEKPSQPQLTPEAKAWMSENPWFGTDKRKTAVAMAIADEWKAAGNALGTSGFFAHVDKEIGMMFDQNADRREAPSKVGGTKNSSGDSSSKGKTYADLPPEAKEACERNAKRITFGENRAYKNLEDWRKSYAANYDWSGE